MEYRNFCFPGTPPNGCPNCTGMRDAQNRADEQGFEPGDEGYDAQVEWHIQRIMEECPFNIAARAAIAKAEDE